MRKFDFQSIQDFEERIKRRGLRFEVIHGDVFIETGEPGVLELYYVFYGRYYNVKFIVLKNKVKVEGYHIGDDDVVRNVTIIISLNEFDEVLYILMEALDSEDIINIIGTIKGIITRYL
jgi:hypothetical protein